MISTKTKLITLLVMCSLLTACAFVQESTGITKRKHRKGFYLDWLTPAPGNTAKLLKPAREADERNIQESIEPAVISAEHLNNMIDNPNASGAIGPSVNTQVPQAMDGSSESGYREYRGRLLYKTLTGNTSHPGDDPPDRQPPLYGILSLIAFISAFPILNFINIAELILPVMLIFMAAGLALGIIGLNEKPRFLAVLGLILSGIGLLLILIAMASVYGGIFL